MKTLKAWQKTGNKGTQWIVTYDSRTLVKQGHEDALALLCYSSNTAIRMREDLTFEFEVQSKSDRPQNLMIDYVIHHMKANGKLAPKLFKLAKKKLESRETLRLSK